MQLIYQSDYKTTHWEALTGIMINRWTEIQMTDAVFQSEINIWLEQLKEYKTLYMLANTSAFNFLLSTDQQNWINTFVFPQVVAVGIRKFAVVENADLITQIGLEDTMNADQAEGFQTKFFNQEHQAMTWFMEQKT